MRVAIFLIACDTASACVIAGDVPVIKNIVKALQWSGECGGGDKDEEKAFHGNSFELMNGCYLDAGGDEAA